MVNGDGPCWATEFAYAGLNRYTPPRNVREATIHSIVRIGLY